MLINISKINNLFVDLWGHTYCDSGN
uniref:Uncharacterized protein n=1 Tax=Arundo donax TaxID=35708 RepID=A0A0A9BYS4_ARUDO